MTKWSCSGKSQEGGCRRGLTEFNGIPRYRCDPCKFDLCDKCLIAWHSPDDSKKIPEMEKLVAILKGRGGVRTTAIENAMSIVDRKLFVPGFDISAYADAPVKIGKIHISSPHIYGMVLEALDLSPGLSFCNIGCGSGYLSALVAVLTGAKAVNQGIDLDEEIIDHCRSSFKRCLGGLYTVLSISHI
eukprot:TRINITY_DN39918_c0_g3_i2.p1 TRINITY_DN39918_c0_g3~~TRINITY_DN39918_c0_g3_i2.p1  ORF type:complete len:187 (+),score=11.02 TRINITY_DN39918_c0_g3_i2:138-698(+)